MPPAEADTVNVTETFVSLQGESSYAGLPCFFIRLAGCNLRCSYCDTPGALEGGSARSIDELVNEALSARTPLIEITGGEPLLQSGCLPLLCGVTSRQPTNAPVRVLLETNGSVRIDGVPDEVVALMDVKCPGSGMAHSFQGENLRLLRLHDEVKFVLSDEADYRWACDFVCKNELSRRCAVILFSPVAGHLDPGLLADWIVRDRLPVRLQLQLHKQLGVR